MKVLVIASALWLAAWPLAGGAQPAVASEAAIPSAGRVLPLAPPAFKGKIGRTLAESVQDFPGFIEPPAGAPNVVVVLLDDVGFGHTSTFGGPVPTPALEQLARQGLRYNRFHTTGICSPTRASLLTGRNPQRVSTGMVSEGASGFPGYNSMWGPNAASLAEILRAHGYNTSMYGKWHNTPDWESGPTGPFDRWPTGKGFEYFYGFIGGDSDQFHPALYENTVPVDAPQQPGYHLTTDMVDHAIRWIRTQHSVAPNKPFFTYLAPGATHAPLQAPKAWIDQFKGQFNHGWDQERERTFARQKALGVIPPDAELTPRPEGLPDWDSLSADEQKVAARLQEVYAGFLAHTDHEVGRLLATLDQLGVRDNTLVVYIVGDNGASAEGSPTGTTNELIPINGLTPKVKDVMAHLDELGGPLTYSHYPSGWAWAGSTPFKYFKQVVSHLGAMRNPVVVSWPKRIKDTGGLRSQYHHVVDVMPTILEAVGVPVPEVVNGAQQLPMDGVSMLYSFDHAQTPSPRKTQYFNLWAHRSIYHDGWMASSLYGHLPWEIGKGAPASRGGLDSAPWELYNLNADFSQAHNLAAQNPAKLEELKALFWQEAENNQGLPVVEQLGVAPRLPSLTRGRTSFTFYPGTVRVREAVAPRVLNRAHTISADVVVPRHGAQGMLLTQGGRHNGYALYVRNGRLTYAYNYFGLQRTVLQAKEPLPAGPVQVRYEFTPDQPRPGSGGVGKLFVNGKAVAEGHIPVTIPARISLDETLDVGEDHGTPVVEDYQTPFRFQGGLKSVTVELR